MEYKNKERYVDTTPYYALDNSNPKVGEVYRYKPKRGDEYMVLVIASNGNVCTVMRIFPEESQHTNFEVRKPYFTSSYMLQYCFSNTLTTENFVFCLKDAELKAVKQELERVFAITINEEVQEVDATASPQVVIEEHDEVHWYDHIDDMRVIFGSKQVTEFCKMMMYLSQVCNGPSVDYRKSREYIEEYGASI